MVYKIEQYSLFELYDVKVDEDEILINTNIIDVDSIESVRPFGIGDHVQIVISVDEETNSESYFYLMDFRKKRGIVKTIIKQPSLQYEVEFGNRIAIVYHEELKAGWPS